MGASQVRYMKEIKLQGQDLGGAVLGGNGNDKGGGQRRKWVVESVVAPFL